MRASSIWRAWNWRAWISPAWISPAIGLCIALAAPAALADTYVKGNDTGGIIIWSCESEAVARQIAGAHCAWYGKHARITGVHRQVGEYISFHCLWAPQIGRYQIPVVGVRSFCRTQPRRVNVFY